VRRWCERVFWVRCGKTWAAAAERMTVTSSEARPPPPRFTGPTITKPSRVVVPASRADQLKRARSFRIVIAVALPFMVPQLPPPAGRHQLWLLLITTIRFALTTTTFNNHYQNLCGNRT